MVLIRKAKKSDLKIVSELFRTESAKKPYFQEFNKKTAFEKITEFFKEYDLYLAIDNKKIIGFIALNINIKGKKAEVEELWLKPNYQGKGIGKSLMKFIEDKCKEKGIKSIGLMANQNSKALHFYKKLKYKVKHELLYMKKKIK